MTTKGANGIYYQSGLKVRQRGEIPKNLPLGGLYRAIVMGVHPTDDEINLQGYQVLCDVVLIRTQVPLFRVPVALGIGVNDAKIPWVPKATTKTLSGVPLRTRVFDKRGGYEGDVTDFADMDGDVVIVQFVEGDVNFPVITGRLPHRETKRKLTSGEGWEDGLLQDELRGNPQQGEAYFRHSGTEARVNQSGDVLLDTVAAKADELTEVPDPLSGGAVRVRLKRDQTLTIAGGSIGGEGGQGGADLLTVKQGLDESVEVTLAGSELTISVHPVTGLSVAIGGQVALTRPVAGPALLDLLGASQPFVRGLDLVTTLTALLTALTAYTTAIQPVTEPGPPPGAATGALNTLITSTIIPQLTAALSLTIKGE